MFFSVSGKGFHCSLLMMVCVSTLTCNKVHMVWCLDSVEWYFRTDLFLLKRCLFSAWLLAYGVAPPPPKESAKSLAKKSLEAFAMLEKNGCSAWASQLKDAVYYCFCFNWNLLTRFSIKQLLALSFEQFTCLNHLEHLKNNQPSICK